MLGDLMAASELDLPFEDAAFLIEPRREASAVCFTGEHDGLTAYRSLRAFFHALSSNDNQSCWRGREQAALGRTRGVSGRLAHPVVVVAPIIRACLAKSSDGADTSVKRGGDGDLRCQRPLRLITG